MPHPTQVVSGDVLLLEEGEQVPAECRVGAYPFLGLLESLVALGAFFWFLHVQGWVWGDPLPWSAPLYKQATAVTLAAIVMR